MDMNRRSVILTGAAAAVVPMETVTASAANGLTVEMHSIHPGDKKLRNVFLPRILVVQPGDTVLFKATDKGHNSASTKGMVPDSAEGWKGKINQDISVAFEIPGFYGYQCTPHAALGMVGLVIVQGDGMMDNYETAKGARHRGKAKKVWADIWDEVEAQGLTA